MTIRSEEMAHAVGFSQNLCGASNRRYSHAGAVPPGRDPGFPRTEKAGAE